MSKLRIFIADDHGVLREGLRMLVNSQPDMEVVGEAANGREAIERVRELLPDVAVLDISMPELNGLQATERIKRYYPQVKILTLTRHADNGFIQQLLKAGVDGYVLKQSASDMLLTALRAVASGGTYLDPAVAGKVVGNFARSSARPGSTPSAELSERERDVLRMIAWGHSNKEIATQMDLSVKTVEVHKANAMRKLDMKGRTDIIRYALLQGWLQNN